MKSPTADTPTKQRLLDAAQQLMLAKGFGATTVDEICEAAKLTKGSFFHYFESKDHLCKELLERFCASGEQLHGSLCGTESDPLKRVFAYIDGIIACSTDPTMNQGCLLGTFAQELSDTHPQIRSVCAKGFDAWAKQFGQELAQAKAAYAPRASFDPKELADHFIALLEGSLILAKARQDPETIGRNMRHFRNYVKGLFKR
jgi:TetR/AcrR family transcriptional repressor of nem operon